MQFESRELQTKCFVKLTVRAVHPAETVEDRAQRKTRLPSPS